MGVGLWERYRGSGTVRAGLWERYRVSGATGVGLLLRIGVFRRGFLTGTEPGMNTSIDKVF